MCFGVKTKSSQGGETTEVPSFAIVKAVERNKSGTNLVHPQILGSKSRFVCMTVILVPEAERQGKLKSQALVSKREKI